MKALRKWFGDKSEEEESDSGEDTSKWSEVRRVEKNRDKNKRRMKRNNDKEEQTRTKAAHILGMGPVTKKEVEENTDK